MKKILGIYFAIGASLGVPMSETEEEFQKMKKSLAEGPNPPKGRWEEHSNIKEYIFDKPKKSK